MATSGGTDIPEDYILPKQYLPIPLEALQCGSRKKLSLHLNLEGNFNEDIGIVNNYQGLAELAGFAYLEIRNFEQQKMKSPTEQLLDEWTSREDLSPTFGNLWNFLLQMERFDALTDIWSFIKRDGDNYLNRRARFHPSTSPVQDSTVTQSSEKLPSTEDTILTVHDVVQGGPTMYDAFICYSPEGPDLEFVKQLIEKLEDEYELKLFVPWRDDLPGASHSTVCASLIEQRCKRMVIVLSPRYLQSEACDFQTKFAHSLSPGSKNKKLVPILFEYCVLPQILRHMTLLDYTKKDLMQWFWTRLSNSLKAPQDSDCIYEKPEFLHSLSLDTSSEVCHWSSSSSSSAGQGSRSDYSDLSNSSSSAGQISRSDNSDHSTGSISQEASNGYDSLTNITSRSSHGVPAVHRNSPTHGISTVTQISRREGNHGNRSSSGSPGMGGRRNQSPSSVPPPLPPTTNRPKEKIYYC